MKSKIAVQTMIFSEVVEKEGYEPMFRFLKEIGVNELELSKTPVNKTVMPDIRRLCKELDMHVCCMNVNMEPQGPGDKALNLKDNLEEMAGYANELNCRYLRVGSMPSWAYGKEEAHYRLAELVNSCGKRLAPYGIQFYYHNHEFEFQKYNGKYGLEILMENTDPQYVGFELDVHWIWRAGQNPVDWIRRLQGRADLVHLKDYRIVMPKEGVDGTETSPKEVRKSVIQFAEIGTGNLDMKGIIETCVETGVRYMPIEQDTSYDLSPFDSIHISVDNIKKMGFEDYF
ncbi:MAG: sugar phosphate isomerase/epimerase [bacterium]|nr:sugar phosphate isomerase/epimerase [bacterium]